MATVQIEDGRSKFLEVMSELRKSAKRKNANVRTILSTISCELLAKHCLYTKQEEGARFDSYYLEEHEFTQSQAHRQAQIRTEVGRRLSAPDGRELGRFRSPRRYGNPQRQKALHEGKDGQRLGIEIKAPVGLDISQLERYILSGE